MAVSNSDLSMLRSRFDHRLFSFVMKPWMSPTQITSLGFGFGGSDIGAIFWVSVWFQVFYLVSFEEFYLCTCLKPEEGIRILYTSHILRLLWFLWIGCILFSKSLRNNVVLTISVHNFVKETHYI